MSQIDATNKLMGALVPGRSALDAAGTAERPLIGKILLAYHKA